MIALPRLRRCLIIARSNRSTVHYTLHKKLTVRGISTAVKARKQSKISPLSLVNLYLNPRDIRTPLPLPLLHPLNRTPIRHQSYPLPRAPRLPLRRPLRTIRIRIEVSDKACPIPLHDRHDVPIRRRITRRRRPGGPPNGRHLCPVLDVQPRRDGHRVQDVVAVVPGRDVVGGHDGGKDDARADVAGLAVGGGGVVPVRGRGGVVERIERVVVGQHGGVEGGELVDEEGFGVGGRLDGRIGEDGAFVGVVAEDGGHFQELAGGEGADWVVGHEVVVEDGVVGEYGRFGGVGERFVEVGGLEGGDREGAQASQGVVGGGAVCTRDEVVVLVLALCYCADCGEGLRLGDGGVEEAVVSTAVCD